MSEIPKTTREVFAGSGSLPNLQWVERVQMLLGRIAKLERENKALRELVKAINTPYRLTPTPDAAIDAALEKLAEEGKEQYGN